MEIETGNIFKKIRGNKNGDFTIELWRTEPGALFGELPYEVIIEDTKTCEIYYKKCFKTKNEAVIDYDRKKRSL